LALSLSTDRDARRKNIHVGPFSEEEAYQYIERLAPNLEKEVVDQIITKLGSFLSSLN